MKKFVIRFFTIVVLIALGATVVTGAFSNPRAGVVFVEEEIHGNKAGSKDNGNFNDKSEIIFCFGIPQPDQTVLHYADHNAVLTTAYRSLPEMPPDPA